MAKGSLVQAYEVTTSQTVAYQTPSSLIKTQIQKAQLVNTGVAAVTVNVWITPDSTTIPTDLHKVLSNKQIGVNQTYIATELIGEYVNSTAKISVQGSALGVSFWVDGNTIKAE